MGASTVHPTAIQMWTGSFNFVYQYLYFPIHFLVAKSGRVYLRDVLSKFKTKNLSALLVSCAKGHVTPIQNLSGQVTFIFRE